MSFEKGLALFRAQNYTECEVVLRKLANNGEGDPATVELYAFSLHKLGRFEDALGLWNTLISRDGGNPEYYCERGVCKFNLGYRSALEDLDKALEMDPENPYRHSSRAYVLDKYGRTEEAYHGYLEAARLDPEDEITQNNLGIVEQKLGYTKESRERFAEQERRLGLSDLRTGPDSTQKSPLNASDRFEPNPKKGSKWAEIRKMLSSGEEFSAFLKEARALFRKGK